MQSRNLEVPIGRLWWAVVVIVGIIMYGQTVFATTQQWERCQRAAYTVRQIAVSRDRGMLLESALWLVRNSKWDHPKEQDAYSQVIKLVYTLWSRFPPPVVEQKVEAMCLHDNRWWGLWAY